MEPAFLRIGDLVRAWAEAEPDRPALLEGDAVWSYGHLAAAVVEAAQWLAASGIGAGDRVLLVADNTRPFVALLFALGQLDAWPVLVNPRLAAAEVTAIHEHAGASASLFVAVTPPARRHAQIHGARPVRLPLVGEFAFAPAAAAAPPEPLEADIASRVGAVLYTSGSTGRPKGVMLSHRGLVAAARGAVEIRRVTPADRLLGVLPLTHSSGLGLVLLTAMAGGAAVDLLPRFDPGAILRALEQRGITVFVGTPAIFAHLVEYADFRGLPSPLRYPALRLLSSCGSPLTPAVKADVERRFSLVLHNGYGATECSPGIASTTPATPRTDISVGRAYPGIELKLLAPDGAPAAPGEPGELCVRGTNVMKGYYRAPEETAAALDAEGWYHTGDLARFEGEDVFLLGRGKELILRFGFNVYPPEVEAALESHPAVAHAAVIGERIADTEGGETIVAFVQPRLGAAVAPAELDAYLRARLAAYKCPDRILVAADWPLTSTGKIFKPALRDLPVAETAAITRL